MNDPLVFVLGVIFLAAFLLTRLIDRAGVSTPTSVAAVPATGTREASAYTSAPAGASSASSMMARSFCVVGLPKLM